MIVQVLGHKMMYAELKKYILPVEYIRMCTAYVHMKFSPSTLEN